MKKLTTKLIIAATVLVAAAGVASAQKLTAEIPFEFRLGNRVMAAGTYQVGPAYTGSSIPLFLLQNMHSRSQAFLLAESPVDPQKAWRAEGNPKLAFMCTSGRCTIAELWDGPGSEAYKFRLPKLDKDDDIHLTVIPMHRDKGE